MDLGHTHSVNIDFLGKHGSLIVPLLALFSITDITVEDWFIITLTWMVKLIIATFAGIGIYEYFADKVRFKKWANSGYKKEDKDKFRIK